MARIAVICRITDCAMSSAFSLLTCGMVPKAATSSLTCAGLGLGLGSGSGSRSGSGLGVGVGLGLGRADDLVRLREPSRRGQRHGDHARLERLGHRLERRCVECGEREVEATWLEFGVGFGVGLGSGFGVGLGLGLGLGVGLGLG